MSRTSSVRSLVGLAALLAMVLVPLASADTTGTLALSSEIDIVYPPGNCPPGSPDNISCFTRRGTALIPGLGKVEESYAYNLDERPAGCPPDHVRGLPSSARLTVVGKGTIEISVGGTDCLLRVPPSPVTGSEAFTVTGGSGRYAGAAGRGTIGHVSNGPPAWRGVDTWTGSILVAGVEFDLTPPAIQGAVARSARAPRGARKARVKFKLSATDGVDGPRRVACTPKSGARFRIGRTIVRCSATDTSANRATARFVVTVRKTPGRR